jgi:hypothetical protein
MSVARNPFSRFVSRGLRPVKTPAYGVPRLDFQTGLDRASTGQAVAQNEAWVCLYTPSVSKTINSIVTHFNGASGSPTAICYIFATSGGLPTGAFPGGRLAQSAVSSVIAGGSLKEFDFVAGSGAIALTAGTTYAFVFVQQVAAASFSPSYLASHAISGASMLYTSTVSDPIQNTTWLWSASFAPLFHINWSDGAQECSLPGFGTTTAGDTSLYWDGSDPAVQRMAGISITPAFDLMLEAVDSQIQAQGTASSAGSVHLQVLDAAKNVIATSSNAHSFTSTTGRLRRFTFSPTVRLLKGKQYFLVASQTAAGQGSATNFIRLNGSNNSGNYPPEAASESLVHGIFGVRTTTGKANLAAHPALTPWLNLYTVPWRQ